MNELNDYTMVRLIVKYSDYFANIINTLLKEYFRIDQITTVKEEIRDELKREGILLFSPEYARMEKQKLLSRFVDAIGNTDKINLSNVEKQNVLAHLYKACADKMNKTELNELRALLFGKQEYLKITRQRKGVVVDYDVLFSKKPEKIDDISNQSLKTILDIAIEIANTGDIELMVSAKTGDPQLYNIIANKITTDFFNKEKGIPIDQYTKMIDDPEKRKELDEKYGEEFTKHYTEYFKNNLQLFNKEDLLLNTAARIILGVRKHKGDDIEEINAHFFDGEYDGNETEKNDCSVAILRAISEELEKREYSDSDFRIMSTIHEGKELFRVNKRVIKEFLDRCTETEYISDEDIKRIKAELLEGIFPEDKDILRIVDFNISDLIDVCKSYETREESDPTKQGVLISSTNLINHLLDEGKITIEKVFDLYISDSISFDIIDRLPLQDLEKGMLDKKFKTLYDELVYSDFEDKSESERINNKLNRLSAIYIKYEEEGLTNSDDLIETLLNAYGLDHKVEILCDLNAFGILGLEQCLEKCIEEERIKFLKAQYNKGTFTPVKIRELYDNSKIAIDEIAAFIKEIDENKKKYMTIGAIFPGENEEDCEDRDLLVAECINVDKGITIKTGRRNKKVDPTFRTDGSITDPFSRLSFFEELDEDYEIEMTSDGHVIVKCNNSKKTIIEKLLDKNGNPYYGAATYVLDEDYYKKHKDSIYISDMIARHELSSNADINGVDKVPHNKDLWGERIKEIFGVNIPGKYTEEKIARIDEAKARVERSRKSRSEI